MSTKPGGNDFDSRIERLEEAVNSYRNSHSVSDWQKVDDLYWGIKADVEFFTSNHAAPRPEKYAHAYVLVKTLDADYQSRKKQKQAKVAKARERDRVRSHRNFRGTFLAGGRADGNGS